MRVLVGVSPECSRSTKSVSSYLKVCGEGRMKKVVIEKVTYQNPVPEISKPMGTRATGRKQHSGIARKGSAKSNNKVHLGCCTSEDCEDSLEKQN